MFTGLIAETGEIVSLTKRDGGGQLFIKAKSISSEAKLGDSIAINGTCLTVVKITTNILAFDLSDETLKSTNLGQVKAGDLVNLEPALRVDAKLGGHFVTGHIDGIGRIKSRTTHGDAVKIFITAEPDISEYLVEKGSVAVDGISLTVVDVSRDGFSIVIIPHTARLTTIGFKGPGDTVNIEVDILGKYVSKFLNKGKDIKFMHTLIKEGFA